jgi:hypothetical protein
MSLDYRSQKDSEIRKDYKKEIPGKHAFQQIF